MSGTNGPGHRRAAKHDAGVRIVVALGGNALLRRHEKADAEAQRRNVKEAVTALRPLASVHELVVTHGNGPQVGLLALQAEAYRDVTPYPLDILGAETEGMIGYLLDQEFVSQLPGRRVATLLTQVEVDPRDPAFGAPTKPIGPVYDEETARRITTMRGWPVGRDGHGYRRLVPSPAPLRIIELDTIALLVDAGVIVVCAGGGGIPVVADGPVLRGVEAVVDKDLSAALLAVKLDADALLLLTDVNAVYSGWGTTSALPIRRLTSVAARKLALASGSMGPKVEAAARFADATGALAVIGALTDAPALLTGTAGTRVLSQD